MFFPFVEVANASIAKWKLWRVGLEKINTVVIAAVTLCFPKNLYQMDFSSLSDNQLVCGGSEEVT